VDVFEYLSVLVSVILGLGITHLLAGTSKMIHHRNTMRLFWPHIVWTVNLLILILAIWWGMFWWSTLHDWFFFQFLFIATYSIFLFLSAGMLYPWTIPADFDFEQHFMHNRRWFFGFVLAGWVIDIPETLLKADIGLRDTPTMYLVFAGWNIASCLLGIVIGNRTAQLVLSLTWFAVVVTYLGVTTLAEIAA